MEIKAHELRNFIGEAVGMMDGLSLLVGEVMSFEDKGEYIKTVLYNEDDNYPRALVLEIPRDKTVDIIPADFEN